jgi:hypothetical protein
LHGTQFRLQIRQENTKGYPGYFGNPPPEIIRLQKLVIPESQK